MNHSILNYVREIVSAENLLLDEPMSKHTTMRVGGEAKAFVNVQTKEQLQKLTALFGKLACPYFVIGKGSNLIVGDKGYDGIILNLSAGLNEIEINGNILRAQAGASLPLVANYAAKNGLSGLEFAAGIPGTVGGAIVMNAGAYDGEMKQVVKNVTVLNSLGEEMVLDKDTMEFGYRTSIIKNRPFVVLETQFSLAPGNPEEILAKGNAFNEKRREKQPLEYPSAGSTFKRPEGYFAGKLIMEAGLRGFRIGGAQVSEKHCGFVINVGNANAADIRDLIEEVTARVKKHSGVVLEPEVIFLGDF